MDKNFKVIYLLKFPNSKKKTLRGKRVIRAMSKIQAMSRTEDIEKKKFPNCIIKFEQVLDETILGFFDMDGLDKIFNPLGKNK